MTQRLEDLDRGDPHAAARLLPLVYDELRRLAAARLAHEKPGQTLQPTALVHEAYVRLVGGQHEDRWAGRAHFFAAAAEAMRRVLVESARRKKRHKRGGDRQRVELGDVAAPTPDDRLLALDEALARLALEDPVAARVVGLRHFAGLGHEDVAAALGVTVYQARQKWTYARAWLSDALERDKIPPRLLALAGGDDGHAPAALVAVLAGQAFLHSGPVVHVRFSPDGKFLASCTDKEKDVKVWDAATGAELFSLSGHTEAVRNLAFSADGKRLATGSGDRTAKIWDWQNKSVLHTLTGHADAIRAVCFSPKGDRLVTASNDMTACLWDAASGEKLLTFDQHTAHVTNAAFSPDGTRVATSADDGTARVWEADTGKTVCTLRGHTAVDVTGVCFSKDGQHVATSAHYDSHALVFDAETGKHELTLLGQDIISMGLAGSPDGTRIARSGVFGGIEENSEPVRLYDAGTGKQVASLTGHRGAIFHLAYSADGNRLAGGGVDRRIHVWDVTTGRELILGEGHVGPVNGVALSPDGRTLASGGGDRTVRLWDLATGRWQRTLTGHEGQVTGVAFHPGGGFLATGGDDGTVRLWDLAGDKSRTLGGHDKGAVRVAFSPDGKTLASAGGRSVKLWDVDTGKLTYDLPAEAGTRSVAFSGDGKVVAAGCEGGAVRLWDPATGWELPAPHFDKGADVLSAAFHPKEGLLAVAGPQGDGGIRLWRLDPPGEVQKLDGHTGAVRGCVWRADGRALVSAGQDGTVRAWDLAGPQPRSRLVAALPLPILGLALSPEGRYAATANPDGTVSVLRLAKRDEVTTGR
jgi:RNA polymerase sigma factor (TIGR02999 family)